MGVQRGIIRVILKLINVKNYLGFINGIVNSRRKEDSIELSNNYQWKMMDLK